MCAPSCHTAIATLGLPGYASAEKTFWEAPGEPICGVGRRIHRWDLRHRCSVAGVSSFLRRDHILDRRLSQVSHRLRRCIFGGRPPGMHAVFVSAIILGKVPLDFADLGVGELRPQPDRPRSAGGSRRWGCTSRRLGAVPGVLGAAPRSGSPRRRCRRCSPLRRLRGRGHRGQRRCHRLGRGPRHRSGLQRRHVRDRRRRCRVICCGRSFSMSAMCSASVPGIPGIVGDDGGKDRPASWLHRRLLPGRVHHVDVVPGVVLVRHRQSDRGVVEDLVGSL